MRLTVDVGWNTCGLPLVDGCGAGRQVIAIPRKGGIAGVLALCFHERRCILVVYFLITGKNTWNPPTSKLTFTS